MKEVAIIDLYLQTESNTETLKSGPDIQTKDVLVDACLQIVGVWRWNDLARTITRFYEDGKAVSKNLIKSEGRWECIDPQNPIFTTNTWGKKREIKMSEDTNQIESINALLGTNIIAKKISSNPLEKITPTQTTNIPRL